MPDVITKKKNGKKLTNEEIDFVIDGYVSGRIPLFHFDVYRLSSGAEFMSIGADEYFYMGGICVIEWADLIAEILPDETKMIFIEHGSDERERIVKCTF